ncbi:hypothetical protein BG16_3728 [Burkholderia pseudomallei MSHR2543]|nr:hypothetical protein BG16_3728 [Burkholderia pseudomallei MSHR2543]
MRARVALFRESAREIARDIACGNEAARAARGGTRGFDPERGANDTNDAKAACAAFAPDPLRAPLSRSAQLLSIAPAVRLTMPQNQPGRISQETIL